MTTPDSGDGGSGSTAPTTGATYTNNTYAGAPIGTEHQFLKEQRYVDTAIELLKRESVIAQLFWNWSAADFAGAENDAVNVKVPGRLVARDRKMRSVGEDRRIKMDYLAETKISVNLDQFPYSAVPITDEQLTWDIPQFAERILQPQVRAVVQKLEGMAVKQLEDADYADGADTTGKQSTGNSAVKGTLKAEDFYGDGKLGSTALFNRVRRNLNARGVPVDGRIVVIGTDLEEEILNDPNLVLYQNSGDSSALRDATIGRMRGFDFVVAPDLKPNEAYAFHRTAFVMATAAPLIPAGATKGSTVADSGFALRWMQDYDSDYAVDRSVVDAFAGVNQVVDKDVYVDPETGEAKETSKFLRGIKITADLDKIAAAKKA